MDAHTSDEVLEGHRWGNGSAAGELGVRIFWKRGNVCTKSERMHAIFPIRQSRDRHLWWRNSMNQGPEAEKCREFGGIRDHPGWWEHKALGE